MRILHTSDWHLGKNIEGYSRMEEQEAFLDDFIEIVKENQIDMIIIAGDIYDGPNPPARAEKMFYDTLKKLSQEGERMTVVIAGNHDSPERLIAAGPLAREHGIIMVGTPKTIVEIGDYGKNQVVESGEGYVEVSIRGENAVILTVPFLSEKRLNEVLYDSMEEEEERLETYSDRVHMLFHNLSQHYRKDTINIAVSHLFAMGSEEAGSERNVSLGGSYIVNGSCFPEQAQYVALGHIHKPQIVPGTSGRARYAGSPLHYNRKEISFQKKCFLIQIEAGKECQVEEVALKVYKPIEVWRCKNIEDAIEQCEQNQDRNCWVYIEVATDRYIREDEIKIMKRYKKDILEIVPEFTNEQEEKIEVGSFADLPMEEIFRGFYLKERKVEPQQEVVDMLLSIINEEEPDYEAD